MATIQTEEQVVQLDTNTGRAVVTLVTESEENIWLAAVSDEEGTQLRLCEYSVCLLHRHSSPVVTTVLELLVSVFH